MYITYNIILQLQLFSRSLIFTHKSSDNICTKPGIRKLPVLKKKKKNLKTSIWIRQKVNQRITMGGDGEDHGT